MKLNLDWIEKGVKSAMIFGKKNAPSLMAGGSILLGWGAVYVFWKQSRKADLYIKHKEEELKKEQGEEAELGKKEKFIVYLQYCWISLVMGLGSTGLNIWAHKLELSRLMEMYMVSQFLEGKTKDQEKVIEKLKGELPEKKVKEIEEAIFREEHPYETIGTGDVIETGKGNTLFILDLGDIQFRSSIMDVQNGIFNFKELLKEQKDKVLKRKLGDAFYSSDNPYPDTDIYASEDVDEFLRMIGLKKKFRLGDLLEFRDYNFPSMNEIMDYKEYVDQETGVPTVCRLHIKDYVFPTYELIERNPL